MSSKIEMSIDARSEKAEGYHVLNYLPDFYADSPFMQNFLRIFEAIWMSNEKQIDHLYAYFDPHLSPVDFLSWLGTWMALVLNENISEARQRELLSKAVWLYEWRGTEKALREHLRICLDVQPDAIVIDQRGEGIMHHQFRVRITLPNQPVSDALSDALRKLADQIVQAEKPAHTSYVLDIG